MVNWPGSGTTRAPSTGSSSSVQVSASSRRRFATLKGAGTIGPAAVAASAAMAIAVDVEEPQPRPLEPADHDLGEARHQVVAELWVALALAPQAHAVEAGRAHEGERAGVEVPPVRGKEPRPADDLALLDRLDH